MNAHRVRLDPAAVAVEPGGEATTIVRITNVGDVVDAFDVEVLGAAAAWTAVEPATVSLFPGAEGTARLTFRPPRSPDVPAGPMLFAVRVQSQDARLETSVVEEGELEVGRFTDLAAEILPRTSHGRFSGRHRVQLTNRGNAPTAVRISGSDVEQALDVSVRPATAPVWPAGTATAWLRARCARLAVTGPPRHWSFKVLAEADETKPVELQATMEQHALLGKWTVRALAAGVIAVAALAALSVMGIDLRQVAARTLLGGNSGRSAQAANGQGGPATPSATPTARPTPAPTAPATAQPAGPGAPPAVPAAACVGSQVTISSPGNAQQMPGLAVNVNNGPVGRLALVKVSANLGVDPGAEVRVAYSVDGAAPRENAYGPANLADHQQYYETRAVSAVIPLTAGSHSVAAFWRVEGPPGRSAYLDMRCLTVTSVLASAPPSSPLVMAATCASGPATASSPSGAVPMPGMAVTVNNGDVARQALVDVSANLGVDAGSDVRVTFSVDGAPPQENVYGPSNLADHQESAEGRDVTAVIPLAAGSHTIAAYWRVNGLPGRTAAVDKRCLTVESATGGSANGPAVAGTCPVNQVTIAAPAAAAPMPGLAVTVDNGSAGRVALVDLSANLGVDPDAEVRVAYSVDGAAPQENAYGPANLANTQQGSEGRDATAVISLGPGTHTITAYWRVNGPAGKTARMDKRCLTVDSIVG